MFEPIFARAGTDKKAFIVEKIKNKLAETERRLMFIVPEQSSFETEKELYLLLGDKLYSRLDVLSFTRLCNLYFEKHGISKKKKLSSAGKLILTANAISSASEKLTIYSGQALNQTFIQKISSIIDELKVASISPEELLEKKDKINGTLNIKLGDLALIYSSYESQLKNGYLDPSSELANLNILLKDGSFFKDYDIIIDEFASFNSAQLGIIEKMFSNSESVLVFLCMDNDLKKVAPAFKTPSDTYKKLKNRAKNAGAEICAPKELEAGVLYNNAQLKSLEAFICAKGKEISKGENIKIYSSPSVKRECRFVAAEIKRLVREEGLRYRDIAIIGRNMDDYLYYLEDSLRLYDIPSFSDLREKIDTRPIVVFINNLIETVIENFEPSSVLRLLKSGISYVSADDTALLENYIELWRINKRELTSAFYKNPDGLNNEINTDKLNNLNAIREKAVAPLITLRGKLKNADAEKITRSIYEFLKQNGILKNLSEYTELIAREDSALASEQHRAFEICMNVMSQLCELIGKQNIPLSRYLELFKLGINAEDVGSIPHHLDEVQIGDAGRTRIDNLKATFLVGVNDSVFPSRYNEDGFFTDEDRSIIRESGMDILTPSKFMNQNEEFYLYRALSSSSDLLYISYSHNSVNSQEQYPSKIISRLEKCGIPILSIAALPQKTFFGTDEAAFEQFCLCYNQNTAVSKSLREYFFSLVTDEYRNRFLGIDTDLKLRYSRLNDEVAKKLYAQNMLISPTQMDSYYKCCFAHFCKYGLGLETKKKTEVNASNSGTAVHEVLEKLLSKYSADEISKLSDDALTSKIESLFDGFIRNKLGEKGMNERGKYSIKRLKTTVLPVIKYIVSELSYSGFAPSDFELCIKKGEGVEPYVVKTPNGNSVGIKGIIDRVDIKEKDGKTYVRIVDYKTGSKVFDKNDIEYGINLQMFMYLFSIWENGQKKYGEQIVPNGVLYMPAKRQDVEAKGGKTSEGTDKKKSELYRMMGMVLEDESTSKQDDKRFLSASYSDIDGFKTVKQKTEQLLCDMADSLRIGDLSINPLYVGNDNLGCEYCDFKAVCTFEEGDTCRKMEKRR